MRSVNIPAMRARLLARGCTLKPTCPVCGQERDPKDVGRAGRCNPCDRQLAEDYAARFRATDGSTNYPDDDYRSKDSTPF
jgi:tRNA(Ile2) C34 agmatinyltransferase TiaS